MIKLTKTMKVIDLLNKIANGEEVPERIRVLCNEFEYDNYDLRYINIKKDRDNLLEHIGFYKGLVLNNEVEIIEDTPKEDKKIEKFYFSVYQDQKLGGREVVEPLETKINEIIDKINGE